MSVIEQIRACRLCESDLPLGAKPVIQAHPKAKILISGQAPSLSVHKTGVLFNDASGKRLRAWLGVNEQDFYNPELFAIVPMGFCYPGRAKSGDMPPIKRCSLLWQPQLADYFKDVELHLVVGQYAQAYYIEGFKSVTEHAGAWQTMLPKQVALPHPSPRNEPWLVKNPWFNDELLPVLRTQINRLIKSKI